MKTHHFTFGKDHMTNFPLTPRSGRLFDYWVTVELPDDHPISHRGMFFSHFTEHHCPHSRQFAEEYDHDMDRDIFPGGQLCMITEFGLQR